MDALTDFFNVHSRRLATLASVILVVLMSISVARTALFFIENIGDAAIEPVAVTPSRGRTPTSAPLDIASLSLFGKQVIQREAPQVVDAPKTSLNLELQGVFVAEDPDDSTAIVAERNKGGELFQIGDRLPGNATLDAVFEDHILIRRGARLEKLMFSDSPASSQFTGAAGASSAPSVNIPSQASRMQQIRERIAARRAESRGEDPAPQTTADSATSLSSARSTLETYKERLTSEPDAVMNELGLEAVSSSDSEGYRLSGEIPEQMLNQVGLRRGDVIKTVNGAPVGNIQSDRALIDQAMQAGRVRVEVVREGRRFFLTVPIPD